MNGWQTVRLDQCCEVVSGATPKTNVDEYWGGSIHWITPADLGKLVDKWVTNTPRTLTESGLRSCGASVLPAGSVLFSSRAPIGHVAINIVPMATNQGLKSFVPQKDLLDASYLYYWLRGNRSYLESLGTGATFKEVSKAVVSKIELPLPPLEAQRRIARILDQADEMARKWRQAITLLDDLAESTFLDMFNSHYSEATISLGDHLTFITSGGRGWATYYSDIGSRFIRSLDVRMNEISHKDAVYVTPPNNAEAKRTKVKSGDVLLTITGSLIGRVAPVFSNLEGSYISQHVAILRPDATMLDPGFLAFFLSLPDGGQRQISQLQYGQTKPGLNFEQIRAMKIPFPPIELQQSFQKKLRMIKSLAASHREQLAILDALFASLQARAFRNEL